MRRWSVFPVLLIAAAACGGDEPAADTPAPAVDTTTPAMDTSMAQAAAPAQTARPTRPPAQQRTATVRMPAMDEPWTPTDTGTVSPGMTRDDVVAVWGAPVTERTLGAWTYLYFRNGCEISCGTFDVVFLENGQVVNAIVRGRGHTYAGASTSPAGQPAKATLPSGTQG